MMMVWALDKEEGDSEVMEERSDKRRWGDRGFRF